jgi:hypothetical protein
VASVLSALALFLPALVAAAVLVLRWRRPKPVRVLAEAVAPSATISGYVDPVTTLDTLLAELEGATIRLDGADELDEHSVAELERLADKLEAAAASLERVA